MRAFTLSAALVLLAAGPALAGDPRGGGHHRPPPGPPPAPCCDHGGGSRNVNINVNASARAFAEASATSHFNARTYEVGGFRGGGHGGTVYVGGGYGGDAGGYGYVGAPVYYDIDRRVLACASAPFGYVVTGFGREGRRPPSCGRYVEYEDYGYDRGGRYGYSERRDSYEERSYESYESYEEYEAWEEGVYAEADHDRRERHREDRREAYRDEAYAARQYDRGYMDGRRDCDCRPDGRDGEPYYAPPPPPAPPVREPEIDTSRPYRPAPPRQEYRQEYGERG